MQGVIPNFQYKRFVRASEEPLDQSTAARAQAQIARTEQRQGEEIKQFYDNLIKESEVKKEIKKECDFIKKEKFDIKAIKKEKIHKDIIRKEKKYKKLIKKENIVKEEKKIEADIKIKNEVFDVLDSDDDIR